MDYKKIIISQDTRLNILKILGFLPDKFMVQLQYRMKTGRRLNLRNPQRYSEKLQWYKLYYRTSLMTQCADKYSVRVYIKSKGLESILNKLYAVYNSANDINLDSLPEKFVIKTTNGSGTNIFCKEKSKFPFDEIKPLLDKWLSRDNYAAGREWAYKDITPRIIIEEYMEDNNNPYEGINDYKFICFNGKARCVVFDVERFSNHKRNFYDTNWNFIDVSNEYPNFGDCVPRPEGLEEMISVANTLAEDFPFVRVDLYWVNDKVYFGELTFYPSTGYVIFNPDDFDLILGKYFELPSK